MKELDDIVSKALEGNYLMSAAKEMKMKSEILALFNVVEQRELLLDFIQWLEDEHDIEFITPDKHEQLDIYLSSNSG